MSYSLSSWTSHHARAHEREKRISTQEHKNKHPSIILQLLPSAPHLTTHSNRAQSSSNSCFQAGGGTETRGEKTGDRESYKSYYKVMEKKTDQLEEKIMALIPNQTPTSYGRRQEGSL